MLRKHHSPLASEGLTTLHGLDCKLNARVLATSSKKVKKSDILAAFFVNPFHHTTTIKITDTACPSHLKFKILRIPFLSML